MEPSDSQRQEAVRAFEARCRAEGLALTSQRRLVFAALLDNRDHPDADAVFEAVRVRLPGISRTTVYRILDALSRIGMIDKALHAGAATRFDGNRVAHHHLVCVQCDRIFDVCDKRLDALPRPDTRRLGFTITDGQVQFRGVCAACRKRAGGTRKG